MADRGGSHHEDLKGCSSPGRGWRGVRRARPARRSDGNGHHQSRSHDGNVTTCAQVGFPGSVQYNGSIVTSVDVTALFTATVVGNKYVTISNIASGVVFQAVVLKGGNGYNVYNPPVASMRSPLNNGGNVQT